ncbi:alpha-ketoglutarate-dependent dioxygenase AlkB [Nostoc sp. DSM 114167]|jgi:alkylated DNA repair dioxygenase AlkB|uniref:alpha-ketoglutarate-dependent dioxygenase AlkB n=1 Tax=Nostoc sp. DSM 114167 TaxID=3439050 RepID=UPI004045DBE7
MDAPAIYLKSDFIHSADALFQHLKESVSWDERMKSRKTASFGVSYNYSQISYKQTSMPSQIEQVCTEIHRILGFFPNNCLLNYYPNGNSSMGFHSDSSQELAEGTGVAIVSLGSVRSIVYRHKHKKDIEFSYPLPNGSLLYMSNEIQEQWLHAILKAPEVGERISLTFRLIVI